MTSTATAKLTKKSFPPSCPQSRLIYLDVFVSVFVLFVRLSLCLFGFCLSLYVFMFLYFLFCVLSSSFSRIYEILPQRIQQWQQSPCVAEEMGRRQLERIRKEQQAARLRLTLMEKRFHELEGIIANAKQQQVQHHEEVRDGDTALIV